MVRCLTNQTLFLKIYNKYSMVSHTIPCWHHPQIGDHPVRRSPYTINWFGPLKEGRANFLTIEISNPFQHIQSISVCQ
jgi:hypothetical protein